MSSPIQRRKRLTVQELVTFAMFGALMYVSKVIMEVVPNVHLLAMFIIVFTIVYRAKAVVIVYVYVMVNGLFAGFAMWWLPYLYIWTILWGVAMLLPYKQPEKWVWLYCIVGGLHGLAFGTLYAPAQALMFGLDFQQMLAWIVAGLPYDCVHGIGNLMACLLVVPLVRVLRKISRTVPESV